jgi:hypothetical protein
MGNRTPFIVSNGDDETDDLVLDDFGDLGRCWRESDIQTNLETVITDLMEVNTTTRCGSLASIPSNTGRAMYRRT